MPIYHLQNELVFPHPNKAEDNGLLAIGGDLKPDRLILAYSNGIFPWYSEGDPILWWSPGRRLLLFPEKLKISKSFRKSVDSQKFEVKFDKRFKDVITFCAEAPRKEGDDTWITDEMKEAYINLHKLGYAHSVETYYKNKLVGGLYGISLGKAFFGESMFRIEADASKVALYYLTELCKSLDFMFIDAQMKTDHLVSLGAEEINREEYLVLLEKAMSHPTYKGTWR